MWVPVAILIIMGLIAWHRFGPATSFAPSALIPSFKLKDVLFWSVLIFAFAGSEAASFMGDEIKNPRRSIPLALFAAGLTVVTCYILGTVSVLIALPQSEVSNLQGLMQAISKTAHRIGFDGVIPWAALLITLSNLGAAGAFLAAVARLPFVAGRAHFLTATFGVVLLPRRTARLRPLMQ